MVHSTLAIKPNIDFDLAIEIKAKKEIARGAYISNKKKIKNKHYYEFGLSSPKLIIDVNRPPIIKHICIDNVFSASVIKSTDTLTIEWPDRKEVSSLINQKRGNLIRKAENALVTCLSDRLIKIPKVQNGLNPLKEILLTLYDLSEIPKSDLFGRMGKNKAGNYIDFLVSLDFIKSEDNNIYPGNELTKFDLTKINPQSDISLILLNDVLLQGFRYLTEKLNINILTPYLELSNAYYLQSHLSGQLLNLEHTEIERHYAEMYPRTRHKPLYQTYTNLIEMKEAEIIQGQKGVFSGYPDLFDRFTTQMPLLV